MNIRSTFDWPHPETRDADTGERAAHQLAFLHRLRARVPAEQLNDNQWAIMLELYVALRDGRALNTTSLLMTAGTPLSTMLRMIDNLVEQGLVLRRKSDNDRRMTTVFLSEHGEAVVERVFSDRRGERR